MVTGPVLEPVSGAGAAARGAAACRMGSGSDAEGRDACAVLVDVALFFSFTVNWSPRLIPSEEIANSGIRTSGWGGYPSFTTRSTQYHTSYQERDSPSCWDGRICVAFKIACCKSRTVPASRSTSMLVVPFEYLIRKGAISGVV
jgi:hypothetical protein